MKTKIEALQKKRNRAIQVAENILSFAQNEGRELRVEEAREFDSLMGSMDGYTEAIRALDPRHGDLPAYEGTENRSGYLNTITEALKRPIDARVDLSSGPQVRDWAGALRDSATGEALRGYRHDERIGEVRGGNPNELGVLIRDMVAGSQDLTPERRAIQVDQFNKGGVLLTPAGAAQVWDLARAASVVSAAGAVTVPVPNREMTIGKITADPTAAWVPERGNIDLDDDMLFGAVNVRLRKLALRIEITDETMNFTNAAELITRTCSTALAQEMDRAALAGTGAGEEPLGILNTAGILTGAADPAAITFDQMIDVYTALQVGNVQPKAFIVHPTMNGNLQKIKDGEGQYFATLPGDLQSVRKHVTSKMDSTKFLMGDFSNLLLLPNRGGIQIDLVKDVVSGRGCWLLQLIAYMDTACVWPNRFYALTGVNG